MSSWGSFKSFVKHVPPLCASSRSSPLKNVFRIGSVESQGPHRFCRVGADHSLFHVILTSVLFSQTRGRRKSGDAIEGLEQGCACPPRTKSILFPLHVSSKTGKNSLHFVFLLFEFCVVIHFPLLRGCLLAPKYFVTV